MREITGSRPPKVLEAIERTQTYSLYEISHWRTLSREPELADMGYYVENNLCGSRRPARRITIIRLRAVEAWARVVAMVVRRSVGF